MKKQLSSITFMIISFVFGILAIFAMFIPLMRAQGQPLNCLDAFFDQHYGALGSKGAWPSFLGYMLIVLATLIVGFVALPFVEISYKTEKFLLILSNILLAVGATLVMLIVVFWCVINQRADLITAPGYNILPGSYITMGFCVFAFFSNCYALKLDA